MRRLYSLSLLAALAWPAAASAREGEHPDRIPPGADAQLRLDLAQRTLFRVSTAAGPRLASSWCGAETGSDLGVNGVGGAVVKVVYAHPADVPDRFADYVDLIQSDARGIADAVMSTTGGARSVRFDTGTACAGNEVDIASVALPRSRADYLALDLDDRADRLAADVAAKLGPEPTPRDHLVFADGLAPGDGTTGVASRPTDDRPGAVNGSNAGGYYGFVFGDGSPSFGVSHQTTAEHELLHLLGGVQDSAPHATGNGHCWQTVDVLCYDDGGRLGPGGELVADCANAAPTTIDCGGDDYFNPSPVPGSYLATHWNVYDSAFLCAPASCFAPGANLAPEASFSAPPSVTAGTPVTFDASPSGDAEGPLAGYAWDVDGDGVADGKGQTFTYTYARAGVYTVHLLVADAAGATGKAAQTVTVGAAGAPAPVAPSTSRASSAEQIRAALQAAALQLNRAIQRAGGLKGLKRGRMVRVRVALPARGRLVAKLDVRRKRVATARAHTAPSRRVTLTVKLGRKVRHRLPARGTLAARLAFQRG